MGRHLEAIAEAKRALELDPYSTAIRRGLGSALYQAGDYDQGIVQLKAAMEMEQSATSTWVMLHVAYESKGMYGQFPPSGPTIINHEP